MFPGLKRLFKSKQIMKGQTQGPYKFQLSYDKVNTGVQTVGLYSNK